MPIVNVYVRHELFSSLVGAVTLQVNLEGHRHTGSILIGLVDYFERHVPHVVRLETLVPGPVIMTRVSPGHRRTCSFDQIILWI